MVQGTRVLLLGSVVPCVQSALCFEASAVPFHCLNMGYNRVLWWHCKAAMLYIQICYYCRSLCQFVLFPFDSLIELLESTMLSLIPWTLSGSQHYPHLWMSALSWRTRLAPHLCPTTFVKSHLGICLDALVGFHGQIFVCLPAPLPPPPIRFVY